MKSLIRKLLLGLLLVGFLGALGIGGWYLYRIATRPTFAKSGGTILVYEVDGDQVPAGDFSPEELAEAVRRRVDPDSWLGITVGALSDKRIKISIPRSGDHTAGVQQVKLLIAQVGALEFRILANATDDRPAFDAAHTFFASLSDVKEPQAKRRDLKADLEHRASRGLAPPPPVNSEGGNKFPWKTEWGGGESSYSWVELDREERHSLGLNNDAKDGDRWKEADQARQQGRAIVLPSFGNALLYSRDCTNYKLPPGERARKKYEY